MGGDGEPWGEGRAQQQDASLEKTQDVLRGGPFPRGEARLGGPGGKVPCF